MKKNSIVIMTLKYIIIFIVYVIKKIMLKDELFKGVKMGIYLGIDGGGTKTEGVVICDGKELGRVYSGPTNCNSINAEKVIENICTILFEASKVNMTGSWDGICMGCAGYSNSDERTAVYSAVRKSGISEEILYVCGDDEIALAGALSGRNGMVLISGTGSICLGKRDNIFARSGGYGHLIDDFGSGYSIGREILSAAMQSVDGRISETKLTAGVHKKLEDICGSKISESSFSKELVRYIYDLSFSKLRIASFSTLLDEAVFDNDAKAIAIAQKEAFELFRMVKAVDMKLWNCGEDMVDVVFAGSVLRNCKSIGDELKKLIEKNLRVRTITAEHDAAYGAGLIATDKFGRNRL